MIVDARQVEYFKAIASEQYVSMVIQDFGNDKRDILIFFTDTISLIYRHLQYNSFKSVTIFVAVDENFYLNQNNLNPNILKSYENLSPLKGDHIVIEIKANGDLHYLVDYELNVESFRSGAIIYKFLKSSETEIIYGKITEKKLRPIPDADSYFAIQTYKDLDVALEDYSTKMARHSECVYLKEAWSSSNRIFFRPRPEHILRDSLTQFLKMRLRNTEVRPEQIVDKSHPVDIKVTWSLASHLALIEIKWLGKSSPGTGRRFKQMYFRQRALDGAKQLAEYLDENLKQSPGKTTKGYLVIYDGRRWGCNKNTTTIDRANGLKYENDNIIYEPEYHSIRTDFIKPIKFFLEPVMT